jgi:nicotinate-nucleotide pyrophosphorylase (carboxylating)
MSHREALRFLPLVAAALEEDAAYADVTTLGSVPRGAHARAGLVARSAVVVAGLELAALVFHTFEERIVWEPQVKDGAFVGCGHEERADGATGVLARVQGPAGSVIAGCRADGVLARVQGPACALLSAERVALNFVCRLSGIATRTRAFVDAVAGLPVRICDTRKTTPGWRALERYAVRAGGGYNHRCDLAQAVLIKDNHILAAGSIAAAVRHVRAIAPASLLIEVECDTLAQVEEALACGVDAVLLDNMTLDDMRRAVTIVSGQAAVEASGGITLENVRAVAETGVDVVSVGGLTHSAPAADLALDFLSGVQS